MDADPCTSTVTTGGSTKRGHQESGDTPDKRPLKIPVTSTPKSRKALFDRPICSPILKVLNMTVKHVKQKFL